MSRLIDADVLIDYLGFANTEEEKEENIGEIVALDDFDRQPTAFDVDKVIEQMKQRIANFDCKSCRYGNAECEVCDKDCSDALIDDLLDIVKGGGVDGGVE